MIYNTKTEILALDNSRHVKAMVCHIRMYRVIWIDALAGAKQWAECTHDEQDILISHGYVVKLSSNNQTRFGQNSRNKSLLLKLARGQLKLVANGSLEIEEDNKSNTTDNLANVFTTMHLNNNISAEDKKHCVKSMLYQMLKHKVIRRIIVYTPTSFNGDYKYVPAEDIVDINDMNNEQLMQHLNDLMTKLAKVRGRADAKGKNMKGTAVIFDDCFGQLPLDSKIMRKLVSCHRHFGIYLFFTSQYLNKAVPTYMRSMVNHAIMFRTTDEPSVVGLHKAFGGFYKKEDDFRQCLMRATQEDYRALVYNGATSKTIEDAYLCWQANTVPDFVLVRNKRE